MKTVSNKNNHSVHPFYSSSSKKFIKIIRSRYFSKLYLIGTLTILFATTFIWSLQGARIQQGNADQLVYSDLFKNFSTFQNAIFSGAHSFLLKWPIFLLIKLFGSSGTVIMGFTVATVLLTVAALVAVIYKIERRHLVFGTICLALASVLLLVPAQPYPGGLLPVNMAMLTTRNLEYILYILGLVVLIRSPRIKSWGFWLASACLSLLIASDKLFLIISVGGALIALIIYARSRLWDLVSVSVNLLSAGIVASIAGIAILLLINSSHLTHIAAQSSASPYNLSSTASNVMLGAIYSALGFLTNFGANPAYDSTTLRSIPHQLFVRLTSLGGPAYLINLAILAIGLLVVYYLLRQSWTRVRSKKITSNKALLLSLMLIWSTAVAFISFIATKHYYAVDARYLTIGLFAVFISIATYARGKHFHPEHLVGIGAVILIGIVLGLITASRTYSAENQALANQSERNTSIVQALAHHKVDVLVGDYWRVIPIKLDTSSNLIAMPLSSCTMARQVQTSKLWQPDLHKRSFAYLLTLDGSLTDYPNCKLNQVVDGYGRPNSSILISGSLSHPKELLLFYDRGINDSAPKNNLPTNVPATVLPITLSQLPNVSCDVPTVMNIVAHQDDDLLFMNPDLLHDIKSNYCVRTVFVTAGDDGSSKYYWISRQQGSEAAYSYMLGSHSVWIQRIVELTNHEFITVANPKGNSHISLVFMNLPDGNLQGQGFKATHYQSLAKLVAGKISLINSVDDQSYYNSVDLISALSDLMNAYEATEIHTQSAFSSKQYPDHSDHRTVGQIVTQAYTEYEAQKYANQVTIPIKYYIGYPGRTLAPNVSGADLVQKEATYFAYAKFDAAVCKSVETCLQNSTFGYYLTRQYETTY